jgi:CRP-like cAMP-binding protein
MSLLALPRFGNYSGRCSASFVAVGARKDSAVAQGTEPRRSSDALPAMLPLAEKLGQYCALTPAEREFLVDLHQPRLRVARRREIIVSGRRYEHLFILCSGVVCRYKVLQDGKRQVLNLGLPGDIVGFPSCLFEVAINSVASLTEVELSLVSFDTLYVLFSRFPRLGTALFWASAFEAAMYGEHIVNLGRKSAYERLAHLLLELLVRLRGVGADGQFSYTLPLTQELIADVLGLSEPHVNRMIRCLREEGLATMEDQRVVIHDFGAMSALAGFEEGYLKRAPISVLRSTQSC